MDTRRTSGSTGHVARCRTSTVGSRWQLGRDPVTCITFTLGFCIAVLPASTGVLAQGPAAQPAAPAATATLTGLIGDSLHGGPLAGALVMVDQQDRRAFTDSLGRFRIDSIAPGSYRIGIFHPTLDSIGLGVVSTPIAFVAGAPVLASFAIPSGSSIRRTLCSDSSTSDANAGLLTSAAVLAGRVLDPETETPLVHVMVTVTWMTMAPDDSTRSVRVQRQVTTDIGGRYHICALPSGLTADLQAASPFHPQVFVERPVILANHIVTLATMHLAGGDSLRAPRLKSGAVLVGFVQNGQGTPVAGVTVAVPGTNRSTVSGRDGIFSLSNLPTGTHTILARAPGFAPVLEIVELSAHAPQHIIVALVNPINDGGAALVAAQQLHAGYVRVGFERRRRAGFGQFLTASDIASRHVERLSQLLAELAVVRTSDVGPRGDASDRSRGDCLMYFLDGRPLVGSVEPELDAMYQAGQIMGIEIYRGESVPQEFRTMHPGEGPGAAVQSGGASLSCPTVVLWSAADLGLHVGP